MRRIPDARIPTDFPRDPRLKAAAQAAEMPVAAALAAACYVIIEGVAREPGRPFDTFWHECAATHHGLTTDEWRRLMAAFDGWLLDNGALKDRAMWVWRGEWQIDVSLDEWGTLRAAIFARDDYRCTYCGARGGTLECDHIMPLSRGGRSTPDNLTTACLRCNRSKGRRTREEWKC
jgi:hypothetical protein